MPRSARHARVARSQQGEGSGMRIMLRVYMYIYVWLGKTLMYAAPSNSTHIRAMRVHFFLTYVGPAADEVGDVDAPLHAEPFSRFKYAVHKNLSG